MRHAITRNAQWGVAIVRHAIMHSLSGVGTVQKNFTLTGDEIQLGNKLTFCH
jgi:hypothetical protein